MKRYARALILILAVLALGLYFRSERNRERLSDIELGKSGWPAAITWDEPYVGFVNIFVRPKAVRDQAIKLFVRGEDAWFCLPALARDTELELEFEESFFSVFLDGKSLSDGMKLTGEDIGGFTNGEGAEYTSGTGEGAGIEGASDNKDYRRLRIIYKSDAYGEIEREYNFHIGFSENLPAIFVQTESGSMEIVNEDKLSTDRGVLECYDEAGDSLGAARIREIRAKGQSSFDVAKKNYRLELAKETELLGMDTDSTWVLCANALDASKLRNALAYDLARELGIEGSPDYRYADVYFNGEYGGNYMLVQPAKAAFMKKQFADDRSFMLETESWEERLKAESVYMKRPGGLYLEYVWPKEPDEAFCREAEGIIDGVDTYIASLDEKDDLEDFSKIADVRSFARIYLMNLLTNEIDSGQHSTFCYYDGARERLVMGPVWDYDKAWGNQKDVNAYPEFEAFAHTWPEMLSENTAFGLLALSELDGAEDFIYQMTHGALLEKAGAIAASWQLDRVVNGGPISSVIDAGSLEDNARQLADYLDREHELVREKLESPGSFHRIYFESMGGRAWCLREDEELTQEAVDYLKKLYKCDGFNPQIYAGMKTDKDLLVIAD